MVGKFVTKNLFRDSVKKTKLTADDWV